ncbi:MAG: hypothetical protein NTY00_07980 [Deltaproteobacteria bacterium]|nr:hypothetical protein [Deltaproteobacteria bacterium]
MTMQESQRTENALAWWQNFKKQNSQIATEVFAIAEKHNQTGGNSTVLTNSVFWACHAALVYDKEKNKDHQKKRKIDKVYLKDRCEAVKNLDAVIEFLKHHDKKDASLLRSAMFALGSNADNTVLMLSELKEALTTKVKCFTPPHSHQHGCFLYPVPVNTERTATTPRMLAVNLVGLFRLYTSGNQVAMECEGWPLPKDGKPYHPLVERIVKATFSEDIEIDAKSAEADFIKNSPGVLIVPWTPWGE